MKEDGIIMPANVTFQVIYWIFDHYWDAHFWFCTHVKDTLETHYGLIDWTGCDYHQDVVTL